MKFTRLMPLLRTRNLPQTVVFYRDRFDLECTQQTSELGLRGTGRNHPDDRFPNAHEPFDAPCFAGSLYFSTDVDELWRS